MEIFREIDKGNDFSKSTPLYLNLFKTYTQQNLIFAKDQMTNPKTKKEFIFDYNLAYEKPADLRLINITTTHRYNSLYLTKSFGYFSS